MTASLEEYLKTIYLLKRKNAKARITDIASYLGYAKASVNRGVNCLKEEGYLTYESYGNIELTDKGKMQAEEILKRYNTIKAFLVTVLEVKMEIAEKEAKLMKHAMSEDTINKLEEYIQTIVDVSQFDCNYNPESEACKKCAKATAKRRVVKRKK